MADRDAKKVERQLDRISAGLPSGVGGFLRWLRSPLLAQDLPFLRRPGTRMYQMEESEVTFTEGPAS